MKILVTGGAGFIGTHLVHLLLKENCEVVVLDNLTSGVRENLPPYVSFKEMDVCDEGISRFIRDSHFDSIVHLAGQTTVNESILNPKEDARINVLGTINLLESIKNSGSRIIFASSAAVYGNVDEKSLPVTESQTLNPMSFYALTKMTAEQYFKIYHEIFGIDYVILRFSNVYGEYQGSRGEGGVISIFSKLVSRKKNPTIYGDGMQTRDFIHAEDISRGIFQSLTTKNVNSIYNLSTQTEVSLNDLITVFSTISDLSINTKYQSRRDGDIRRSSLSNQRARKDLLWQPKISLTDGLRRTYNYFKTLESE